MKFFGYFFYFYDKSIKEKRIHSLNSFLIMKHTFCKECLTGYFGWDCKEPCSGQCAKNEPCDHVSGICHSGCQDGYQGNNCNSCKEYLTVIL